MNIFKKKDKKDRNPALKKQSLDIVTNLFITAKQRAINEINELLVYEIDLPPPALIIAKTGEMKFSPKSKLIDSMIQVLQDQPEQNSSESVFMDTVMAVIDASVMIQSNRPKKTCKKFFDYADILIGKIEDKFNFGMIELT